MAHEQKMKTKIKDESGMYKISVIRLILRSVLLVVTGVIYLVNPTFLVDGIYLKALWPSIYVFVLYLFLLIGIIKKLVPSKTESLGSEKQFLKEYVKKAYDIGALKKEKKKQDLIATVIFVLWMGANFVFYVPYFMHIIDAGFMLLVALLYHVLDMVCVTIYCPFQRWFLRNRCCITCRIYNWDQIFTVTPLLVIGGFFGVSLSILGTLATVLWEVRWHTHTERFLEMSNGHLSCTTCGQRYGCAGCVFRKQARKKKSIS